MYQLGHRVHQRGHLKQASIAVAIVAIVSVTVGIWYIETHHATVVVNGSKAVTTTIGAPAAATKTFNEADFTISLPKDWVLASEETAPGTSYTWHSTLKYQDARTLDLYVDDIPTSYAISRLLPVTPDGNKLTLGTMSDDCSSFTGPASPNPNQPQSLPNSQAKWAGISFICNLSNYDQNAVGTGSGATINTVKLTGPTTGTHSFFFVYTDHTIEPDYSIFTNALESFRVK